MNGAEVKEQRLKLNLTQQELGALLEVSGNTVARWERGEVAPPGMLRWAFTGLAARFPTNTTEIRRRRVKHREERRRDIRELAAKLEFPSAELGPVRDD